MVVTITCLKKINIESRNKLHAELCFPKIVIVEDMISIRIVDIDETNESDNESVFLFENEISDYVIRDNFIWCVLSSGVVSVIDILKANKIKITYNSYANYKIARFLKQGSDLLLVSEGGERLCFALNNEDLHKEGIDELTITLMKFVPNIENSEVLSKNEDIYIYSGKLMIKCPYTGLIDIIQTNINLEFLSHWDDMIVLSGGNKMWIINEKFEYVFQYDNNDYKYYPLSTNKKCFFYLKWTHQEVEIYSSTLSCLENQQDEDSHVNLKSKVSSIEALKLQLTTFVDEIVSTVPQPGEVLPQLQKMFNGIDDYNFLVSVATKLCNHSLLYKPILYPLQKKIYATEDNQLVDLICDVIIKSDLLEYILFRGGNCYENIHILEMNFLQLCITFISKSDLDLASICWLKYSEIRLTLNSDDIVQILNAIPYNIKIGALIIWFRNFVPPLLEQNVFYIDLFVKWTTDRVFLLEQSSYWPKIGLKFISSIIDVLETSIKTIYIRPISIDDLDIIKDHIIYITELKEKYKINMLLSEFSSQSPSEIALIMLRRCYTEDLEAFVYESLPTYVSRHLLEIDDTLRSFIDSEAASSGGSIDGPRLKILLSAFRAPCNKLDCLLNVLKILDVPWDTTVLTIATEAASLINKDFTITDADRAIAQEIYKELNYAKIKVILKKYNFPLTCTDYVLILHKVISAPSVDLDDLEIFMKILTTYTNYACVLYINRCLQDCETKKALIYLNNINNRNKRTIVKSILNKFEQIIMGGNVNQLLERNYIDFLKGTQLLTQVQIVSIENLYYLKNSYSMKLNLNEINSNSCRASKLCSLKGIEEMSSSSGRGRCISQLLGKDLSQESKLICLLRGISSSPAVRLQVESLILTEQENKKSVLLKFKDGHDSDILLESYNVLSAVSITCDEEHIHVLLKSLSVLNALINASTIWKNLSVAWKFQYIFLPMSTINALNDLIFFYINASHTFSTENFLQIANKGEFIMFRIIAYMMQNNTTCDIFCKAKDKVTKRLLTKIVSLQELDQVMVTSLLLTLRSKALEDKMWILELLKGQSDTLSPSAMLYLSSPPIRRIFAIDDILPGSSMSYPPQYILKSKFNINLSEVALPENEETWDVQVLLFHILRHYPRTPFNRLMELCQTLNISQNEGLSLLLISSLTNWDLRYKISENELGCRQIITDHDPIQFMSQCFVIWHSIKEKDFIKKVFNDLWNNGEALVHGCLASINPYYYEVYVCIYKLIFSSPMDTKHLKEYYLLNFLNGYQRKSSPKQYEFELFSVKGMFPEIGYYRLPFHLFMRDDMWSNLKSEITLETYESWLPVVSLLSLDGDLQTARDMICSNAVKQTMTNRKRTENNDADIKDNEPWRLTSQEEPLLRTAHRCVRHIANMEWAGACLFYALQGCARGADQVAAAQLCYQFSQRWATLQPGNRAVRQMEKLHSSLSTRHVLHKIEWACEELIRLSTEPIQLIHALYLHPKFVEKVTRHDINRAANEIADKNSINISSIRIQLLESILDKTYKENNSNPGLDPKDLITAKYILKATCPKMGAFYLSRIAFDDESDYNKCKKLRALQCLMSAVEPETAVKVTRRERNVLWKSLLELFYIVHLERIDMPWVIATFLQDKALALSQVLQVSGNNIESLKIAAELANKFGDTHIIRDLIPILMKASLFEEIIPLLLKVQHPPDNIIYSAWRAIILSPFQRADYPITDRQKVKCLNALNLLPVCPVIKDEDLIEIWKNCIRCKCLGLGCLVLPYMTAQTRQTLNELKKIDKRTLIINLKNLHTETYLVSGAMFVLENLTPRLHR